MFNKISEFTDNKYKKLYLSPHYSDRRFKDKPKTVFCENPEEISLDGFGYDTYPGAYYSYSDRLSEWYGYKKIIKAKIFAKSEGYKLDSAEYISCFLSFLYESPVKLVHAIAGVNRSDGYPYAIYGTIKAETNEQTAS